MAQDPLAYLKGRKAVLPVVAVIISAQLNQVKLYARGISLSASNAKYIAARAGEKAMVFRPVTNAMVDMSHKTSNLVELINKEALSFSRASIALMSTMSSLQRMNTALNKSKTAAQQNAIRPYAEKVRQKLQQQSAEFAGRIRRLEEHLEGIAMLMREAEVIGTISRVEATRTEEYRNDLELISEAVNEAMLEIKNKVQYCRSLLGRAVTIIHKHQMEHAA